MMVQLTYPSAVPPLQCYLALCTSLGWRPTFYHSWTSTACNCPKLVVQFYRRDKTVHSNRYSIHRHDNEYFDKLSVAMCVINAQTSVGLNSCRPSFDITTPIFKMVPCIQICTRHTASLEAPRSSMRIIMFYNISWNDR